MAEFDLVFEGGGAKGMVLVGAMKEFERQNHTPRRLIGTSAGAITATLMAAGYNAQEIEEVLSDEEPDGTPTFATFMDAPVRGDFSDEHIGNSLSMQMMRSVDIPLVPDWAEEKADKVIIDQLMKIPLYRTLFSFIERGGLYAGNAFVEWFKKKLDAKIPGSSTMTIAQFHDETNKDLSLCASDTTDQQLLVLNHRTAPHGCVFTLHRLAKALGSEVFHQNNTASGIENGDRRERPGGKRRADVYQEARTSRNCTK